MKNLCFLFLFSVICTAATAQSQNYGAYTSNYGPSYGPESESGKCYAQCLLPGDTVKTTESILIKPGWKEPFVLASYPQTTDVTYTVKEKCTTCDFEEKTSVKTEEKEVIIKPGYWKYFTTPCEWKTVYDSILVREEVVKYEIIDPEFKDDVAILTIEGVCEEGKCIPAVTGTEKGRVEIKEACTDLEVAEYIFEDEEFVVQVSAPTKEWVKQRSDYNCLSADPDDCMVWRLVDIPGKTEKCVRKVKKGCPYGYEDNGEYCVRKSETPCVYKDYEIITCKEDARFEKKSRDIRKEEKVDIKVLTGEAGYREIVIPAKYKVIPREVVVKPPQLDSIYVKPVIKKMVLTLEEKRVKGTITGTPEVKESCTKTLCTEPEIETKDHGPKYKTVTKIKINEGSFTEWREVLCPAEENPYTIGEIQNALYSKGYNPGPIDRKVGEKTRSALVRFQKENGLPVGQLDLETLEALGIKF